MLFIVFVLAYNKCICGNKEEELGVASILGIALSINKKNIYKSETISIAIKLFFYFVRNEQLASIEAY